MTQLACADRSENEVLKCPGVAELVIATDGHFADSSKPPSSDGPVKPGLTSLRGKSKRKPGSQYGPSRQALELVSDPDVVFRHDPACCSGCGVI